MPELEFHIIPDNRRRPTNPSNAYLDAETAQVEKALEARIITSPFELIVVANGRHLEKMNAGTGQPFLNNGNVKTWFGDGELEAVHVGRKPDNAWDTEPNQNTIDGTQWTTRELYDFYRQYESHFPMVPRFVLKTYSATEVARCQFGHGPAVDFPLARIQRIDSSANFRSSFPKDIGFRVNDSTGNLEWFRLSLYRAKYAASSPSTVVPPLVAKPAGAVLLAIQMILANPETSPEEKVARIKVATA
jgi:hypothetical protein